MRATIVAVRALLDGDRLPLEREGVRPLRLGAPPEQRVPIYLAALAPASVRLAGRARRPLAPVPLGTLAIARWPRPARGGRGGRGDPSATGIRERAARHSRERGDGPADRRGLAARIRDAHGPDLSADAPGPLGLRARSMPCSRPTTEAGAAVARGGRAPGPRSHRHGDLRRGTRRRSSLGWMRRHGVDLVLPLGLPEAQLRDAGGR